mmetsp:Transcript_8811/g.14819  ORF Transcript_8811/g.14819 Transcript_8811/m.14819 type:complete len:96 (+) Transcript_8811:3-290(+)
MSETPQTTAAAAATTTTVLSSEAAAAAAAAVAASQDVAKLSRQAVYKAQALLRKRGLHSEELIAAAYGSIAIGRVTKALERGLLDALEREYNSAS